MKANVKEIFISVQGEGPFIGEKQMFIRFCGCNLCCNYCDTDFNAETDVMQFSPEELAEKVLSFEGYESIHSISLTGGEPLLWADFLKRFILCIDKPIYLETNATNTDEMSKLYDYVDFISADIKLPSSSGLENSFELHENFFKAIREKTIDCVVAENMNCERPKIFAKIVFDEKITDDEIVKCTELAKKYDIPLIIQPKMDGMTLNLKTSTMEEVFDKFLQRYKNVRLIPQVHKFLNLQ